ncbi:MAG: DNA primase [Myxococcota bacterium]|nr:DNA primase [Myxococcota bacterium]
MIPDAKIAEIRERADIGEVVGEYISLRRTGNSMKGVCPFHADTDPSFNVNLVRQFYHCFGCGVSGDVFNFLQRIEGIDFIESAKRLAARYSIELPQRPISPVARTRAERERAAARRRIHILETATAFFEAQLASDTGKVARDALKERGIERATAAKYRLGYAPPSWSSLIDHCLSSRIAPKELEAVGLALPRKNGGFYDRFRQRLMFTISTPSGQPLAFSGRALGDSAEDRGAKYINSPETPEYTKGKVLFGLYQARVPISKASEVILVEGNFDVIALAQAGIENAVAPLGTALTPEQAALLRRRVDRVTILFDSDKAGRAAAVRAFPILANAGLSSYLARLPEGEDPDSFVRKEGAIGVTECLDKRSGLLDAIIDEAAASHDGSMQDIANKIGMLRPFFSAVRSAMERDLYRRRIAAAFDIDPQVVFQYLRGSGPLAAPAASGPPKAGLPGRVEERELVGVLLDVPVLWDEVISEGTVSLVSTPELKTLLNDMANRHKRKESSLADLITSADKRTISSWLAGRAMVRLYDEEDRARRAIKEIRNKLTRTHIETKIKELDKKIQLANASGDDGRVLELSREKASLQKKGTDGKKEPLFDLNRA